LEDYKKRYLKNFLNIQQIIRYDSKDEFFGYDFLKTSDGRLETL